ncbi:MAG: sensor histidine kinase [Paracoccaceae bacterium]
MKLLQIPFPSSLMARFVMFAGSVLFAGMIGTAIWVSTQVERIVTANAGATTALYVDSMVSPAIQDVQGNDPLGPDATERLAAILDQGALSKEIFAFKLWNPDGTVIYSNRADLVGRVFPENRRLAVALTGTVNAELRDVDDPDGNGSRQVMEVYSPVRSTATGDIIAVAEFYTTTDALRTDLLNSRLKSWAVVGAVTFAMFLALYAMFAQGNRTIRQQRQALDVQIAELSSLLRQNEALGARVAQANRRIAELNEKTLRRLSADIHDGPAQLIAFAAMRLDGERGQEQVAAAINEALQDLRLICRGMVLPELNNWSVATIVRRLIGVHETRMGTSILLDIEEPLADLPVAKKNCIYRFLQETLNNSARHAAGAGQSVVIRQRLGTVQVEVSDTGPGFDPDQENQGLGLAGLRERIVGLGGTFDVHAHKGRGTCIILRLPIESDEA